MATNYDFITKRGNTGILLAFTITKADGSAVDISGKTVTLNMRPRGLTNLVIEDGACIVTIGPQGEGTYAFTTELPAGYYEAEFFVNGGDPSDETRFPIDAPPNDFYKVLVLGHIK